MSRRAEPPVQAVVMGGGPAGAAVARLLALWGRSVVLLSRPGSCRRARAESLPPSIRKVFGALHLNDAMERAGFLPAEGNRAWWGGSGPTVESFSEETGWQVERSRFDSLLLDLARDAGAVVRSATVEDVDLDDGHPCIRARCSGHEERSDLTAPFVLDCTGRAGIVASTGLRVRSEGPRTLALVGAWRRPKGWAGKDATYTTVEANEDGWAWSMQVDPLTRYVGAMLDPELTDLAGRSELGGVYRSEVEKTRHIRDLLKGARLLSPIRACGATPYWSKRSSGKGFLLVGDASSFIDPLSSYGVKKALASAWLAAVVVNTLLDRPSMEEPAFRFFDAREREAYRSFGSEAVALYEEAAEAHPHPFWTRRACWSDSISHGISAPSGIGAEETEPDVDALRRDPRIRRAFRELKEAHTVRLRIREPLEMVKAPVVRGRELFLHDRLVTPSFPQGLRYLRGVDLLLLCRLAMTLPDDDADIPGMHERCQQHTSAPIGLPDFLGALSFLLAEGILENGAEPWPQSKRGVMALS